jgi:aryl-alcohol dehydrogenase-like predicted oxidoreductase
VTSIRRSRWYCGVSGNVFGSEAQTRKQDDVEPVKLGNTSLEVGRLSLGGLFAGIGGTTVAQACDVVSRALDLGVNYVDTAAAYGRSEEVLGQVPEILDTRLVLSTKLGSRTGRQLDPQDGDDLRTGFYRSLEQLGLEQIDLLYIHEPDRPGQHDWWTDVRRVEGPVLDVLDELKREGLVRYTGLGGTSTTLLAHLCRSGKFDVVLTAFNYSLLWQEAATDVIPAAVAMGMGVVIGSPLQQGALAARYDAQIDSPDCVWLSKQRKAQLRALYSMLDEIGMPISELALRFTLSHPDVHTVLTGAKSVQELEANVDAAERGPLPTEILEQIAIIAAMVGFRPCDEPAGLGAYLADPKLYRGPGALT